MKIFAILCLLVTLSMTLIPLAAYNKKENPGTTDPPVTQEEPTTVPDGTSGVHISNEISVFSAQSGEVLTLSMRDYLIGAVAAEMPASYHDEALKAQALTCLTYAMRVTREEEKNPTKALNGAVLSTDSAVHQAYMTVGELQERWGDNFSAHYDKIAAAVDAVAGKLIVYNNEPIVAVFHAISSGKTESAQNIWGGEYPYLVPADSEGDVLSPQFSTSIILTEKQFAEIAKKITGVKLADDAAEWIGETAFSDTGTVLSIEIGGQPLTGTQVRDAFELRSPTFSLTYDTDGTFTFKVSGYGHGVGMSQYGADYMARQGAAYEEIIKHYYNGVEIVDAV